MKDLTKYFIDLSKLSDEQLKEVEKVSGWNIKHIQTFPILSLRFSTLCQYGKDSDWVKARTELTYPEFIKLFEGGEGEKKCCDNPDIQWNKIEVSIGDKQGSCKDLNFNFCDNCGETFNEAFD